MAEAGVGPGRGRLVGRLGLVGWPGWAESVRSAGSVGRCLEFLSGP